MFLPDISSNCSFNESTIIFCSFKAIDTSTEVSSNFFFWSDISLWSSDTVSNDTSNWSRASLCFVISSFILDISSLRQLINSFISQLTESSLHSSTLHASSLTFNSSDTLLAETSALIFFNSSISFKYFITWDSWAWFEISNNVKTLSSFSSNSFCFALHFWIFSSCSRSILSFSSSKHLFNSSQAIAFNFTVFSSEIFFSASSIKIFSRCCNCLTNWFSLFISVDLFSPSLTKSSLSTITAETNVSKVPCSCIIFPSTICTFSWRIVHSFCLCSRSRAKAFKYLLVLRSFSLNFLFCSSKIEQSSVVSLSWVMSSRLSAEEISGDALSLL